MASSCKFKSFSFEFLGHRPQPKARPRARRRGPFLSVYQEISDFEKGLTLHCKWSESMPKGIRCAVQVDLVFRFLRPHNIPKWKRYKSSRGDVDNFSKAALDAMVSGKVLEDDSQVVILNANKVYVDSKDAEGVGVSIIRIECRTKNGC